MYKIEILHNCEVTKTIHPVNKKEARTLYYKYADLYSCYTRLTVDGQVMNTAQAERHFNPRTRAESSKPLAYVMPIYRGSIYGS